MPGRVAKAEGDDEAHSSFRINQIRDAINTGRPILAVCGGCQDFVTGTIISFIHYNII